MKSGTMADNCHARAKRYDLTSFLAHQGSTITIKEPRITTSLSNEALRKMSLSDCPFYGGPIVCSGGLIILNP